LAKNSGNFRLFQDFQNPFHFLQKTLKHLFQIDPKSLLKTPKNSKIAGNLQESSGNFLPLPFKQKLIPKMISKAGGLGCLLRLFSFPGGPAPATRHPGRKNSEEGLSFRVSEDIQNPLISSPRRFPPAVPPGGSPRSLVPGSFPVASLHLHDPIGYSLFFTSRIVDPSTIIARRTVSSKRFVANAMPAVGAIRTIGKYSYSYCCRRYRTSTDRMARWGSEIDKMR